ncbi:MAG: hypothetical protein DMG06_17375 [Acidobacteria bacterium]|nr:MAG: hypothetical protein DMG06_17375 [Acidobacteriota bacterium]
MLAITLMVLLGGSALIMPLDLGHPICVNSLTFY